MSVEDSVKEIVVKQLGVEADQVKLSASFLDDLGADSLDIVELVMAMEDQFGCQIPEEEAEKMKTVADAVKFIDAAKS